MDLLNYEFITLVYLRGLKCFAPSSPLASPAPPPPSRLRLAFPAPSAAPPVGARYCSGKVVRLIVLLLSFFRQLRRLLLGTVRHGRTMQADSELYHKYSPLRIWAHSFVKFEALVDVLNLFLSPSKNARGCAVNTSMVGELLHSVLFPFVST